LGRPYPKTHEIDWNDEAVWADMIKNPSGIFQFEGKFAFDSLKKFVPKSIFDMSIVTACIRPSGSSYREQLLARVPHKNPSEIIDKLLEDNLGYLIYQEDTIKFLQQICGLSGSEADNIRRAIGRKQRDRLEAALPSILEGYCSKSPQPRDVAETEAKEFLQVIEDSASYQFGYNHSVAYCLLGYLCAYYRYYHPIEFITSFLNNAANEEDIQNGTAYAARVGIQVTMPKWGLSKSDYFFDKEKNIIAKGLSSIKYMSNGLAEELYELAHNHTYTRFMDVLSDIDRNSTLNTRQLDILIKLDFFSDFGNQRELLRITEMYYETFKRGEAKKISKDKVDGTPLEPIISKYRNHEVCRV
jgi:DNA polymerase-3 subunit alpha